MKLNFWGNVDYPTNKEAHLARNTEAKRLKAMGYKVRLRSLTGQMKKYFGFGQPDGRIGTVYKIEIVGEP